MSTIELVAYIANLVATCNYMEKEGLISGDYQFVKLELAAKMEELVLSLKRSMPS